MTLDPILSQFLVALIVAAPVYFLARSNWRKNNGDAYQALSAALNTSGNTIDDLFKMLAEVPVLRAELDQVKHDWIADNQGAWANHDKLVEVKVPPPYVPTKRYSESGIYAVPVVAEKKKQSGFGAR